MAKDKRWQRNVVSLLSPVICARRWPRLLKKAMPSCLMGPRVSKAKGTKQYAGKIAVYLADFLSAAISAAAPAASADLARYDSARVSMTVASQAKHLLPSHGIRVTSDLTRPTGSLVAGKP